MISRLHNKGEIYKPWVARVKKLLNDFQLYHYYWLRQSVPRNARIQQFLRLQLLLCMYLTEWKQTILVIRNVLQVQNVKTEIRARKVVVIIIPTPLRINLTRFRLVNHKVPCSGTAWGNSIMLLGITENVVHLKCSGMKSTISSNGTLRMKGNCF